MPLKYTAAHTCRVSKPASTSGFSRAASRPARGGLSAGTRKSHPSSQVTDAHLDHNGQIMYLCSGVAALSVAELIEYVKRIMFEDVPLQKAYMSSTRIAEVLQYRRKLPPLVTATHLQALDPSATRVNRELAELSHRGIVRKLVVPRRARDRVSDVQVYILTSDYEGLVESSPHLELGLKSKFVSALRQNPTALCFSAQQFTPSEVNALVFAGFFTSEAMSVSAGSATGGADSMSISSAFSREADQARGSAQISQTVSSGDGNGTGCSHRASCREPSLNLSVPNIGPFLHLVSSACEHLRSLIVQSSKSRELLKARLGELWEGFAIAEKGLSRGRGSPRFTRERARKWRLFHGLNFEWVLEECFGNGSVECFRTGSVGMGVRASY